MEIIKDYRIREKYHSGFERNQTFSQKGKLLTVDFELPYTIVIHGTAGGESWEGVVNWMLSGGKIGLVKTREKQYKKGIALFHYIIDRKNGEIVELINPDKWVFHSSSWNYDRFTISIELLNDHVYNLNPYTLRQYDSLFWLIFDYLFNEYPISVITTHSRLAYKYSGLIKSCPGNFDYDKLESEMKKRNLLFESDPKYSSYWGIK